MRIGKSNSMGYGSSGDQDKNEWQQENNSHNQNKSSMENEIKFSEALRQVQLQMEELTLEGLKKVLAKHELFWSTLPEAMFDSKYHDLIKKFHSNMTLIAQRTAHKHQEHEIEFAKAATFLLENQSLMICYLETALDLKNEILKALPKIDEACVKIAVTARDLEASKRESEKQTRNMVIMCSISFLAGIAVSLYFF